MVLPDWTLLQHSLIFIGVLIVVTVILVTPRRRSAITRVAIEAGILLSQTSEFSLLLAFMFASGQISEELFSMSLITGNMTLTPFISYAPVAWWLMNLHRVTARAKHKPGN